MSFWSDWKQAESDSIQVFLKCQHLLFAEEKDYVICPACGALLTKKLPQDSQDKARLYLIYKKLKQDWLLRTGLMTTRVALSLSMILPDPTSWVILGLGDYGFQSFFLPTNHYHGMLPITLIGYLPFFLLFLGSERHKRTLLFSVGLERWYTFYYSWPIRAGLFILLCLWINWHAPSLYSNIAESYMAKHDYLTQTQREKGVELFVWVNLFSIWIVAIVLFIFEFLNNLKTKLIKQANEAYLAAGLEKD